MARAFTCGEERDVTVVKAFTCGEEQDVDLWQEHSLVVRNDM